MWDNKKLRLCDYHNTVCIRCAVREEEAKATELVAPTQQNPPINVLLKKQGLVDMDYDVIDLESDSTWMLIDTVCMLLGMFSRNDCKPGCTPVVRLVVFSPKK